MSDDDRCGIPVSERLRDWRMENDADRGLLGGRCEMLSDQREKWVNL